MLRSIVVLALAGVLVGQTGVAAAESERDRVNAMVEGLAWIGDIAHGRVRVAVHGTVAKGKRREVVAIAAQVIDDVTRRFTGRTGKAHPTIRLCLLPDDARYRAAAGAFDRIPSNWGFYRPDHRVAIANLGASIGNLRHELVHPLVGDDFPQIPAWLSEGVAALYGTARWNGKQFEFLVNYRLRDLKRAIKAGTVPTIAELAASTSDDVHGDRAMVFYAMARYVLLFADRQGKLGALYADLRDAKDRAAQGNVLAAYVDDATFVAWAKRLR